ncbi:hypothetical protein B9T31_16765 [Acinetobacter sp. ANC 4558]|uniref:hypothetical protein n=1 Tax=Acinetobacter sp. ANC 4558 TaxID=1977876 RepID=UPI000A333F7D|nr:hypothetical protein [Acinetobacter sp. ANC 4558]OTG79777.1 hypothetical protein B9T31_16765 [Acinetobacter sp. ANC 4558]
MKKILLILSLFIFTNTTHAIESENNFHFNSALSQLSISFYESKKDPIYLHKMLNIQKLDFSMESLKQVDIYLEKVRNKNFRDLPNNQQWEIILRTGAYVGETIKKNDQKSQWIWVDYETAKNKDPELFNMMPDSSLYAAVLTNGENYIFPLDKVAKYLENGSEDSLAFYGQAILEMQN